MTDTKMRKIALELLIRIEEHGGFSHLLISNEIKSKRLDPKDEGLFTEIVYGTLERKITLDYYLKPFIKQPKKVETWVMMLLRMSLYQMVYLDKVPTYAILNEAVEIAKKKGHKGIGSFVNGVLRNIERKGVSDTAKITNEVERLSIETSHPEWLVSRWIDQYGYEVTKEICEANLEQKPLTVRIQPLKITREAAIGKLEDEEFKVSPAALSPQGIIIEQGNILQSQLFQDGFLTIQDQSSMLVSEMLDVAPHMTVLDTCSAPGGKVTHIAEKMEDSGTIQAYDLHKSKIKRINKQAKILNLTIIDAACADARTLHTIHEQESYDRILVDAPCSGFGVIRSKPDLKYNKEQQDIQNLAEIQLDILESVAPLLKKDGMLIYSTCTIDKEENDEVIKKFLNSNTSFQLDPKFFEQLPKELQKLDTQNKYGLQLYPQTIGTDGFFISRLVRNK